MKKMSIMCIAMICVLTGCGQTHTDTTSAIDESSSEIIQTQESESTKSTETEVSTETEASTELEAGTESSVASYALSEEEIEAARQVAMEYYEGTVFEVISMTYVKQTKCMFKVKVSNGDEILYDERDIVLRFRDGAWVVTDEGL